MSSTGYYQYNMRTVVHCAPGSIVRIPALLEGLGAKRVLLLSDNGLVNAGIVDQIVSVFDTNGGAQGLVLAGVYCDIAPDASCASVNEALKYAREIAADAILAVGGGSVLDASKGVKYALHHKLTDIGDALQSGFVLDSWPQAQHMGIPHIGVATTAGTGAEVSPVAVFFNQELNIKCNLASPFLEPDMAVLDANLTVGLPPRITAATGMDALTHALEAVASPIANHLSDAHAFRAAQLICQNLPEVVKNGNDVQARSTMLQASSMAINGFCASLNAIPVHNCAHAFGALYHIPHGDANAVLLPVCMEFLPEFYLPNASRLAQALNIETNHWSDRELLDQVIAKIRALQADIGSETDFSSWGVTKADTTKIAEAIATDPAGLFYAIPHQVAINIIESVAG